MAAVRRPMTFRPPALRHPHDREILRLALPALGVLVLLARPWLPGLFGADAEVRELLLAALVAVAVLQPVCGVVFVLDGVLIGAGDMRYLAAAGFLTMLAFLPGGLRGARPRPRARRPVGRVRRLHARPPGHSHAAGTRRRLAGHRPAPAPDLRRPGGAAAPRGLVRTPARRGPSRRGRRP